MNMENLINQFEKYCRDLNTENGTKTPQDIYLLQKELISYQNISGAYTIGFAIIEKSHDATTIFHAMSLIENSVLREWDTFSTSNVKELMLKLIESHESYSRNPSLAGIVRKISDLIAKVCKRGHVILLNDLMEYLLNSCSNSSQTLHIGHITLIHSILFEYSEIKNHIMYLTLDELLQTRNEFESTYLEPIFKVLINTISIDIMKNSSVESNENDYMYRLISSLELIFTWHFNLIPYNFRYLCVQDIQLKFDPPEKWMSFFMKVDITSVIFAVFLRYHTSIKFGALVRSCFALFSSLSISRHTNTEFNEYFINSYNKRFGEILPEVCKHITPDLVWTLCLSAHRFQDSVIKVHRPFFTPDALMMFLSNPDFFLHIIETIARLFEIPENQAILIDAAGEFFNYVQSLRDSIDGHKYTDDICLRSLSRNLNLVGSHLIDKCLLQPLGSLKSIPDNYLDEGHLSKYESSFVDNEWLDECSYAFVERLSLMLLEKLKKCCFECISLYYQHLTPEPSYLIAHTYNVYKIVYLFIHGLIDRTSNCFMYFGIQHSLPFFQHINSVNFLRAFFEWQFADDLTINPEFLQNTEMVSDHVAFLVFFLVELKYILEFVKNQPIPLQLVPMFYIFLEFLSYFDLYLDKIMVVSLKPNSENVDVNECVHFVEDHEDKNKLAKIVMTTAFLLFRNTLDCAYLNSAAKRLLVKTIESIHRKCLFDAEWTHKLAVEFLQNLDSIAIKSNCTYTKNLAELMTVSIFYCRLKDSHQSLTREFMFKLESKYDHDSKNFPPCGFQPQNLELEQTWLQNLSTLEGIICQHQIPQYSVRNYTMFINQYFHKFHKIIFSIIIKGVRIFPLFSKYIHLIQNFLSMFRFYSCDPGDIILHIDQFEIVISTYFTSIETRVPFLKQTEEQEELRCILKIYKLINKLAKIIVSLAESIGFNGSRSLTTDEIYRLYSFSKTIIFNIFMHSNSDFFQIPSFVQTAFSALSDLVLNYSKQIVKDNISDLAMTIKFLSVGSQNYCIHNKYQIYQAIVAITKSLAKCSIPIDLSCIHPLIESVLETMIQDSLPIELVDDVFIAFLYIATTKTSEFLKLLDNYLVQKNASPSISNNVLVIFNTILQTSHSQSPKFDFNLRGDGMGHFLHLISVLKCLNIS